MPWKIAARRCPAPLPARFGPRPRPISPKPKPAGCEHRLSGNSLCDGLWRDAVHGRLGSSSQLRLPSTQSSEGFGRKCLPSKRTYGKCWPWCCSRVGCLAGLKWDCSE